RGGHNGRKGERIADRFAEYNDVWHGGLRLKAPEMRSQAAETDLHFVGDAHGTSSSHVPVDFAEITRRENNLAGNAGERFRDERSGTPPFPFQFLQNLRDMRGIFPAEIGFAAPVDAAIIIRDRGDVHPGFLPFSAGAVEFVRANFNQSGSMA